ncbi:MAG TPA: hypothetical protein ENN36_10610 [Candidatus Bathyarchaeota archaeon]|nr:hypothetical protein [Candidatus Bathyarchaeota archaeon]
MAEIEDPVVTLVRLLGKNIQVVKGDGSLADICVTTEWYDRELLKNVDGQVTVGLDHSEDQKLGFSATLRRRVGYARVKIWVVDKPGAAAKQIRNKLRQEVNRVIREKRTKPNQTNYNYLGVGAESATHRAYYAESASELAPDAQQWTEFSAADYEKLWQSDDSRFSFSQSEDGAHSLLLFRIKVESNQKTVKKMVLKFEGYGVASAGNGVTVKAWNSEASEWQNPQTGTGGGDEELTITSESSLTDFIDSGGYVHLLARTTNPSNGDSPAAIHCDYADCLVAVEGISYVDVVSYRDTDDVRFKPYIWRTEFTVKTWLFENVTVT